MNSSYSLEKLGWERQADLRRAARSIELIPLLPSLAQVKGNAMLLLRVAVAVSAAALAVLLLGQ